MNDYRESFDGRGRIEAGSSEPNFAGDQYQFGQSNGNFAENYYEQYNANFYEQNLSEQQYNQYNTNRPAYNSQPNVSTNSLNSSTNAETVNSQDNPIVPQGQQNEKQFERFSDPNSFVPPILRQFNTFGKYFSTKGTDRFGQNVKLYFTQEERDYLDRHKISAQEFFDKFQSKLGGDYVRGQNQSIGFAGPSFADPNSFIPGDMRGALFDRRYTKFVIADSVGQPRDVFLTNEEIEFTRNANMDIATYVDVYQKEFNYDKGQMEKSNAPLKSAEREVEMVRTPQFGGNAGA